MWRLLVPLKYLLISHPEKRTFDIWVPLGIALVMMLPLLSQQFRTDAVTTLDVFGRSSDLLSVLTGFFVAALAAVATFGGPEMDETMPGKPPVTLDHGTHVEPLSRRRFLSFLFGYLAFLSLFMYLFGFAFAAVQQYVVLAFVKDWAPWTFAAFWVAFSVMAGNLISTALLGLFYLTDRIHRTNRKLSSGASSDQPKAKERETVE
ncbi:MAG: hypothetical protein IPK28_20495 [Devosia sp.]|nr:hypothetical protein [Devosia sp.]